MNHEGLEFGYNGPYSARAIREIRLDL